MLVDGVAVAYVGAVTIWVVYVGKIEGGIEGEVI
jgi:hypothetical protein